MTSEIILCPKCKTEKELLYFDEVVVSESSCKCFKNSSLKVALKKAFYTLDKEFYAKDLSSINQVSIPIKTRK